MIAGQELGRKGPPEGAAIMELAILWLLCAAIFLELVERAPEIDFD
ncbi:hypothetical protein [uncultured Bosea sp.]|nr:hypothetical protein [uncultured Bosea sp.]